MSFLFNAVIGFGRVFFFGTPNAGGGGGASFFVLEADGASHIELEASTDDFILEA
jgi:hypothetical protein